MVLFLQFSSTESESTVLDGTTETPSSLIFAVEVGDLDGYGGKGHI
jgi:hypothetical protein